MYINQVIKYKPPFCFFWLCYSYAMLYLSILYASVIKCILGYTTCTCIVCYISRYTIVHVCIIHLRSPDVHHRYPGYSIATLGYNATYMYLSLSYTSDHQMYTAAILAFSQLCPATLCYNATYLSLSYTSGHQMYTATILAILQICYAMLQCYTYIFVIHFLSSNVHPCYPGYSIAMLC